MKEKRKTRTVAKSLSKETDCRHLINAEPVTVRAQKKIGKGNNPSKKWQKDFLGG